MDEKVTKTCVIVNVEKDYDYSYAKEIASVMDDKGNRRLRFVCIEADTYHTNYQIGRYNSGGVAIPLAKATEFFSHAELGRLWAAVWEAMGVE